MHTWTHLQSIGYGKSNYSSTDMEIQLVRVVALDSSKQCSKEHNQIPNELKPDS